jgi:hypothetical protein
LAAGNLKKNLCFCAPIRRKNGNEKVIAEDVFCSGFVTDWA